MKNSILFAGIILVLINTTASLIFQDYETHKMLFGDFSILLTTCVLYFMNQMKTADGFKIGFTLLFGLTGLVRFVCAVSLSNKLNNNFGLLIFILFFCIECLLVFVSYALRNK